MESIHNYLTYLRMQHCRKALEEGVSVLNACTESGFPDYGGVAVENNAGTTLPGTGGIGTTIFYVIGGGLMVAAAILLITKKRMENH